MQFKDIYGQEEAKRLVLTSVKNNRLSHALLLKGIGGTGKLPFAAALAQYVNCLNPTEEDSCGECSSCRKMAQLVHPDVHQVAPVISRAHGSGQSLGTDDYLPLWREHFIKNPYLSLAEWSELTEAENKQLSISIAEIRALKKKVELIAFEGNYKVVIIWHAEKIRTEAANAFLKLLEEPPAQTLILMTVEDTTDLLPTILSRCQIVNFPRLPKENLTDILVIDFGLGAAQAEDAAQISDGSLAKALRTAGHSDSQASFALQFMDLMRMCYDSKTSLKKMMDRAEELSKASKEQHKLFLEYAMQKMRDALMIYAGSPELAHVSKSEKDFMEKFGAGLNLPVIEKMAELLGKTSYHLSRNANTYATFLDMFLQMQAIFRIKV